MARIPGEELERLKAETSLERLVTAAGVELKKAGSDLVGCCPFHDDREPSLVVSPGKNLWHCLGACQAGGSVVDWVMRAEGVSFRHAVELLRDGHAGGGRVDGQAPARSSVRKLASPLQRSAEDSELLEVVDLAVADYGRCAELIGTNADLGLGLVDASVVTVAERLGVTAVATLNHRDFRVVRPRHTDGFELLA